MSTRAQLDAHQSYGTSSSQNVDQHVPLPITISPSMIFSDCNEMRGRQPLHHSSQPHFIPPFNPASDRRDFPSKPVWDTYSAAFPSPYLPNSIVPRFTNPLPTRQHNHLDSPHIPAPHPYLIPSAQAPEGPSSNAFQDFPPPPPCPPSSSTSVLGKRNSPDSDHLEQYLPVTPDIVTTQSHFGAPPAKRVAYYASSVEDAAQFTPNGSHNNYTLDACISPSRTLMQTLRLAQTPQHEGSIKRTDDIVQSETMSADDRDTGFSIYALYQSGKLYDWLEIVVGCSSLPRTHCLLCCNERLQTTLQRHVTGNDRRNIALSVNNNGHISPVDEVLIIFFAAIELIGTTEKISPDVQCEIKKLKALQLIWPKADLNESHLAQQVSRDGFPYLWAQACRFCSFWAVEHDCTCGVKISRRDALDRHCANMSAKKKKRIKAKAAVHGPVRHESFVRSSGGKSAILALFDEEPRYPSPRAAASWVRR